MHALVGYLILSSALPDVPGLAPFRGRPVRHAAQPPCPDREPDGEERRLHPA